MALVLLTIWIIWQGWSIISGRSRVSMMSLVTNSMRSMVIVVAATTLAVAGGNLYRMLCGFSSVRMRASWRPGQVRDDSRFRNSRFQEALI